MRTGGFSLAVRSLLLLAVSGLFADANAASCKDIDKWLSWGEPILKILRADPYGGTTEQMAPLFAGPEFKDLAGRSFSAMSDKQRNKLGKQLSKCSRDSTVRQSVTYPLFVARARPEYGQYIAAIEAASQKAGASMDAVIAEQQTKEAQIAQAQARQKEIAARRAQPKLPKPHRAGELMGETERFFVHFYQYDTHADPRRCKTGRQEISVVVKLAYREEFALRESYIAQTFSEEVLPIVQDACGEDSKSLFADINIEGQYLTNQGDDTSRENIARGLRPQARFGHVLFDLDDGSNPRLQLTGFRGRFTDDTQDLRTYSGFLAQRDRGWRSQDQAAADEAVRQAQIAKTGDAVEDYRTWLVLVESGSSPWFNNDSVSTLAQAYGLATVGICGERTPGGIEEHTVRAVFSDGRELGSVATIRPRELGRAAHAHGYVGLFSSLEKSVYHDEAESGPVRESIEGILRRTGCMGDVHKEYHQRIIALSKQYNLH